MVDSCPMLHKAMRKYHGLYYFKVLEQCDTNMLYEREVFWSEYYNSMSDGYNLMVGGDSNMIVSDKLKGENHYKANSMEYYETTPTPKSNFKQSCEVKGWNFNDFKAIDSGVRSDRVRYFYWIYNPCDSNNHIELAPIETKGRNNRFFKGVDYYEHYPMTVGNFKRTCKAMSFNFLDFKAVRSNEKVGTATKFFWIYNPGEHDNHKALTPKHFVTQEQLATIPRKMAMMKKICRSKCNNFIFEDFEQTRVTEYAEDPVLYTYRLKEHKKLDPRYFDFLNRT